MKLGGVEVRETVGGLLYRARLAEITWEALSVVTLTERDPLFPRNISTQEIYALDLQLP
jgi:hypothetical protein